jgi:antitoxin component YwqK of YwqJK toxin-antitoxin module/HEAT repeat protein
MTRLMHSGILVVGGIVAFTVVSCGPAVSNNTQPRKTRYSKTGKGIYNADPQTRIDAVLVLAEMRDNRSLALLTVALRDEDARVRVAAVQSLAQRADLSVLGALAKAVKDTDEKVRLAAVAALQKLGGVQAVSLVLHRLGVGSAKERRAVVDCLAKQIRRSKPAARIGAVKRLVIMVKAERAQTTRDAAAVLAKIGDLAADAVLDALAAARPGSRGAWMARLEKVLLHAGKPVIKTLLQSIRYATDSETRARASLAPLARIGRDAAPALVALLDWRKKQSAQASRLAGRVLVRMGTQAVAALTPLLKDPHPDRRLMAAALLRRIRSAKAIDALAALLVRENRRVVRAAGLRALGATGHRRAVKPILDALRKDTGRVNKAKGSRWAPYREALVELKPSAKTLAAALKDKMAQVRLVAAQVIARLKPALGAEVVAALKERTPAVLRAVALAAGALGAKGAVKRLGSLASHKDLTVRVNAITALGLIGDRKGFYAVKLGAKKRNPSQRVAVAVALGRLGDRRGLKTARAMGYKVEPVVRAAGRWAVQTIQSQTTTLKNPTLCGLLVAQQRKCADPATKLRRKTDVLGVDLGQLCRYEDAAKWEHLLNKRKCKDLHAALRRMAAKLAGDKIVTHWSPRKRYETATYYGGIRHGAAERRYPSGKLMARGGFYKGRRHGKWATYFENGKKRSVVTLVLGRKMGPYKRWYEDGSRHKEGTYKNGARHGAWTQWYENGQKSAAYLYVEGRLEGTQTSLYTNGKPSGVAQYKAGRREGTWKTWYDNGSKRSEGQYKAGKKTGAWTWYFKSGRQREAGAFTDGRKTGSWSSYDKEGNLLEKCEYMGSGTPRCTQ